MGGGVHPQADIPLPWQTATAADGAHGTGMHSCYQPQRSWAKVISLQVSVCPQGGEGGTWPGPGGGT